MDSLARAVRFHLLMEVEFCDLPNAASQGFSAYQNRTMLCNALISALARAEAESLGEPLHAELLAYLLLLHADEPQTVLPELAAAPLGVLRSAAVKRALALVAALARQDAAGFGRALRRCALLEVGCVLRLLPGVRAAMLQQCNSAYSAQGAVPLPAMRRRLWLRTDADAARCAAAHGLEVAGEGPDGLVRFRSASFALVPKAPLEPPLGPPDLPAVGRSVSRSLVCADSSNVPKYPYPQPSLL